MCSRKWNGGLDQTPPHPLPLGVACPDGEVAAEDGPQHCCPARRTLRIPSVSIGGVDTHTKSLRGLDLVGKQRLAPHHAEREACMDTDKCTTLEEDAVTVDWELNLKVEAAQQRDQREGNHVQPSVLPNLSTSQHHRRLQL